MRFLFAMLLLVLPLDVSGAGGETRWFEEAVRNNPLNQPGLHDFQVTLDVNRVNDLYGQVDHALFPDKPRIRKYCARKGGHCLVRAEGAPLFPGLKELLDRDQETLALNLGNLLLPADHAESRARLISLAVVKGSDNVFGDFHQRTVTVEFPGPTDLQGAFYSDQLGLPQVGVERLTFDFDSDRKVLQRLELEAGSELLTVEIRYFEVVTGQLPDELRITSPDGKIDDQIKSRFELVEGFWLPTKQSRVYRRHEKSGDFFIKFDDYKINGGLPPEIRAVWGD